MNRILRVYLIVLTCIRSQKLQQNNLELHRGPNKVHSHSAADSAIFHHLHVPTIFEFVSKLTLFSPSHQSKITSPFESYQTKAAKNKVISAFLMFILHEDQEEEEHQGQETESETEMHRNFAGVATKKSHR